MHRDCEITISTAVNSTDKSQICKLYTRSLAPADFSGVFSKNMMFTVVVKNFFTSPWQPKKLSSEVGPPQLMEYKVIKKSIRF